MRPVTILNFEYFLKKSIIENSSDLSGWPGFRSRNVIWVWESHKRDAAQEDRIYFNWDPTEFSVVVIVGFDHHLFFKSTYVKL